MKITMCMSGLLTCVVCWLGTSLWTPAMAFSGILAFSEVSAFSDDSSAPNPLVRKRDAKLAEPWLKKAAWFTDFDAARQAARDQRKLIFAYFTRSYSP